MTVGKPRPQPTDISVERTFVQHKLTEPNGFGDCLWLVVPDHPEELPLVWLVMGITPDHMHSVTIPIQRTQLRAVIDGLAQEERRGQTA